MTQRTVAAVDLGATSGRVMTGHVSGTGNHTQLHLHQTARFANGPIRLASGFHWDFTGLLDQLAAGVAGAARADGVASVAVDSWAVDYGLLRGNRLLGEPFHHRDERSALGVARVHEQLPHSQLYQRTGLQFLPFNTVYQLAAEADQGVIDQADGLLLLPDLVNFQLTGQRATEHTNASTTGLLNVHTRDWDPQILAAAGIGPAVLAPLVEPGVHIGGIGTDAADHWGLPAGLPVLSIGSHDTASAVCSIPMEPEHSAYISCGTWGLVGVETMQPITSEAAREANFTNEGGVDRRTRFLRNVMGLWLLSESVRSWQRAGHDVEVASLLAHAAQLPPGPIFDVDDDVFLPPGDMPTRIEQWFIRRGERGPTDPAEVTRTIVESLAQAFARTVHTAGELSGVRPRTIHLVGGGSLNSLLCQRTADRAGLPVVAGPVEATALGNALIQARYHQWLPGSLESLRGVVARSTSLRQYEPQAR